jgi:hypothetical protein
MQLKKLFQKQDDSSHSEYFVMNNLELINFLCSLIHIDSDTDILSDCLTDNAKKMDIIFDKQLLPLTHVLIKNHEISIRYDLLNILTVHFYAQIDRIIDTAISSEERTRAGNSWILHFKKLYSELREETKSIDDSNLSELFLDCSAYKIPKYIPISFSFSGEELVSIMKTIANMEQIFDFFDRYPKNPITMFLLTNPKSDKHIHLIEKYQFAIEEERKRKLEEERKRKLEEERKRKLEEERKRKLEEERKRKLEEERKRKLEEERKRKLEEERKRKLEEERKRKLEEDRKRENNRRKRILSALKTEIAVFCNNPEYRGFMRSKKTGEASLATSKNLIIKIINNYKMALTNYPTADIRKNLIKNIKELENLQKMTKSKKAIMIRINNLLDKLQE